MSLSTYRKKRSFDQTPEPTGGKGTGQKLAFVVQKHAASHLHYDFRLEMDGVLKSWAIPKGPSLNPADKRLAMMVEDHPYNYKDFEGTIPKGNYGAGTVIVWDQGTYEPITPVNSREQAEKLLLKELRSGSVKIAMHGKKLKGEFALVHTSGRSDNAWLLIKHRDKFASESDVTLKDKSVLSGKTLAKMEASPDKVYGRKTIQPGTTEKDNSSKTRGRAAEKIKKVTSVTAVKKTPKKAAPSVKPADGVKEPIPKTIKPMLATLVDHAPSDSGWLYEIKWDGYRAVALCNKSDVNIISRNNKSFNEKFYPVREALQKLKYNAVFDGEICVLKDTGVTSFNALQNWRSEADGELVYYVFDLLWLNGYSLMELTLTRRRELLHQLIPEEGIIRESQNFEASPQEFLAAAGKMGLEGIIAKKADSQYLPGDRGSEWLKIKVLQRHEVVIGGFTKNDDSPKAFSALLVGVYDNGRLQYTGKIGTGFNDKLQKEMMAKFKPLLIKKSPFTISPDVNKPSRFRPNPPHAQAFWLKPSLVCEVSYTEMTDDGVMRHPSFEGLREDKAAKDVHAEVASHTEEVIQEETKPATRKKQVAKDTDKSIPIKPVKKGERKTLLNPSEDTQVKAINGHELKFSNLSKVFWPKEGYTKRDMLNYYYQVAPYIMPYLKDRPQSMNRYPNGIEGKSFYFKDVTATAPDWINQFPYRTSEGEDKNFLVAEDEASLLWMANLGAIEMNPWNCTVQAPENPTWCLIDLDPTNKNTFDQVIETAQVTKQVLDGLGVPSYPKTSGSTGIHVYIPLGAKYSFDECVLFAKLIASHVHQELPKFTSIERMTDKRKGKIYVDFLQNRPKATLAAPYSVRPKPQATVSMPLHWEEIKKGLKIADFTMKNSIARIKAEGDIFKPVLGKGIDISKALRKLAEE
ncbi:DNA ligase D [Danxiaibacter flavus]|uniref:DNA ligase (ATP) n=1 Tax=Danxiaibacter flavus TaxID=3049108 RepID=A0ABV3ZJ64_9BACT|nr:DNA ligase D [Chitinophagaceae bacterium DXS]